VSTPEKCPKCGAGWSVTHGDAFLGPYFQERTTLHGERLKYVCQRCGCFCYERTADLFDKEPSV
jgi:rubrerythrin